MLQRDRQIRTQVHQLTDACLFAASFWLAYVVRGSTTFSSWMGLPSVPQEMFENVWWIYFALVPAAPLVLESQGFYTRPAVTSRKALLWPLFRGSFIIAVGIVVVLFFSRPLHRAVCRLSLLSLAVCWSG